MFLVWIKVGLLFSCPVTLSLWTDRTCGHTRILAGLDMLPYKFVPSKHNIVDMLTKALHLLSFEEFRKIFLGSCPSVNSEPVASLTTVMGDAVAYN